MERKLLIRVLEIIEREIPSVQTGKIAEELGINSQDREFLQIINYLIDSEKVRVIHKNNLPIYMNGAEEIKIHHTGIDSLTELKSLQHKEQTARRQHNLNQSISMATVVLALAAFIDMAINLIINGKELFDKLGAIYFVSLVIFLAILFSFMGALVVKSFTMLYQD